MSDQPAEEAAPPVEEKVEGDAAPPPEPPAEPPPAPAEEPAKVEEPPSAAEEKPADAEAPPKDEKPPEPGAEEQPGEPGETGQPIEKPPDLLDAEMPAGIDLKSQGSDMQKTLSLPDGDDKSKGSKIGLRTESILRQPPESGVSLEAGSITKMSSASRLRASGLAERSISQVAYSASAVAVGGGGRRIDRLSSRARMVLGSVIDIKSQLTGDGADRRAARYMNTYKLDSNNPFNPEKVDKILEEVMVEALENLSYDPEKCPAQAKWASSTIRTKVKQLEFDRYKLVCIVTIGEKNSQDVYATCRFLWDSDRDRYSTYSLENTYVYGIAYCFGLYYE